MAYYPTQAKSSSNSSGNTSTASPKTETDKKVEGSSKYVGSKYTPTPQPAGTPVQTIKVSGTGSTTKTIASSGATSADVQKFQQNVNQPRSNVVTVQQQTSSQGAKNWNNIMNPQQNVSVMPGVTKQLPEGGYIVSTQGGFKTASPRYLPVNNESRIIAAKEYRLQSTGKTDSNEKTPVFTTDNVLMALPIPGGALSRFSFVSKAAPQIETAAGGVVKRGVTVAAEKAVGLYNKVSPTKGYKYVKQGAIGIGTAEVISTGIREGSTYALTKEDRAITNEPGFKQAMGTAYAETSKAQYNQAWYKGVAYQIPGVPLALGREGFKESVKSQFEQQGYTGAALDKRVSVAVGELYAGQIGEGAGFLSISRSSEKIGRGLIAGSFETAAAKGELATTKNIGVNLFKKAGTSIAAAGVIEGAGGEVVQERSRYEPLKPSKIALMGGFGGASAGLIGGTIAATSVNRPVISKTLEVAAKISDPFEQPGDTLQNLAEAGQKRFWNINAPKPQIFTATDPSKVIGFGTGKKPVIESPGKVYAFSPSGLSTPVNTPATQKATSFGSTSSRVGTPSVPPFSFNMPSNTITQNPLGVSSRSSSRGGSTPSSVFVGSNVNPLVPVSTVTNQPSYRVPTLLPNANIPSNPFTSIPTTPNNNIPVNPFTNVPTTPTSNVPTNPMTTIPINPMTTVPVNPFTTINIPTTVPVGRIPPPMPLSFGDLFGGGNSYGGKRKVYINELAASSNLLDNLMFNRKIEPIGKHIKLLRYKHTGINNLNLKRNPRRRKNE